MSPEIFHPNGSINQDHDFRLRARVREAEKSFVKLRGCERIDAFNSLIFCCWFHSDNALTSDSVRFLPLAKPWTSWTSLSGKSAVTFTALSYDGPSYNSSPYWVVHDHRAKPACHSPCALRASGDGPACPSKLERSGKPLCTGRGLGSPRRGESLTFYKLAQASAASQNTLSRTETW